MNEKFRGKYRIASTRLTSWDYSNYGYYFVTICTKNFVCYFGKVKNGKVHLSIIGEIAHEYWLQIPAHFDFVKLGEFIIMPNHLHGILKFENEKNRQSLGTVIGTYKSSVKKFANENNIEFYWQKRFYDHIIRSDKALLKISEYIINNPLKWETDEYFKHQNKTIN
jgi:REP element-mobilizing transposase RayT